MRVLDTVTGNFAKIGPRPKDRNLKPFKYAIMSHTWAPEGEQSYKQFRSIQKRHTPFDPYDDDSDELITVPLPLPSSGESLSSILNDPEVSPKIQQACRVARENGYRYLWADWCCIDKSSSSELSESINSMYQWYAHADVCYAFLVDVPSKEDHTAQDSHFRGCRWFTRGWTLQELIAPLNVVFLANDWTAIGSKVSLGDLIAEITKIDYDALLRVEPLETFSVAQRFSWAAERETTRVEDRAYSLFGILDINMPTLYGEGERAFRRLQEEIMRRTPDQTLFAWTSCGLHLSLSDTLQYNPRTSDIDKYKKQPLVLLDVDESSQGLSLLAPSLDDFSQCDGIRTLSHGEVLRRLQLSASDLPARHYDFTPYGIHVQFPVIHLETSDYYPRGLLTASQLSMECPPLAQWYLVVLGCEHRDFPGRLLGRICYIQSSGPGIDILYSGCINHDGATDITSSDLLPLSPAVIEPLRVDSPNHIFPRMLYIPQPPRSDEGGSVRARDQPHATINLVLPKKNREDLLAQGYTATLRHGANDVPTHLVTLAHSTHTISIEYQHTLRNEHGNHTLDIKAHVRTSISRGPGAGRQNIQDTGTAVFWRDFFKSTWTESLDIQDISLKVPKGWTVSLGLAFFTTNHYILSIQLKAPNQTPPLPLASTNQSLSLGPPRKFRIPPVRRIPVGENSTGA